MLEHLYDNKNTTESLIYTNKHMGLFETIFADNRIRTDDITAVYKNDEKKQVGILFIPKTDGSLNYWTDDISKNYEVKLSEGITDITVNTFDRSGNMCQRIQYHNCTLNTIMELDYDYYVTDISYLKLLAIYNYESMEVLY